MLKNELCAWLSREIFDDKISACSGQLSREALAKIDIHLDLGISKSALVDSIRRKHYEKEYPTVEKSLADRCQGAPLQEQLLNSFK